jgi:hypothetical protein
MTNHHSHGYSRISTDKDECYTPIEWVHRCKNFTGLETYQLFDWDLATSNEVQDHLQIARDYYTKERSFLINSENFHSTNRSTAKTFFVNPPYSLNDEFSRQLEIVIERNPLLHGCILVNANTDTGWFKRLESLSDWLILPKGRISFLDNSFKPRKGNRHWQAILVRASKDQSTFAKQVDAIRNHGNRWSWYISGNQYP